MSSPLNRVSITEHNLDAWLEQAARGPAGRLLAREEPLRPGGSLTAGEAVALFEDQALSRELDVAARELKKDGRSFYTISSAGHEQNGVVGALLRPNDPCFLHYRSGALMMARSRQFPGATPAFDTLLSLAASSEDPISGGRHKVWGSRRMWVPPQTSTIASHVPKAVGLASAITRARRLGHDTGLPDDAIVCCSFGDASANHATALAGLNAARYAKRRGNPVPILFVCEDNDVGISVGTPREWVRDHFAHIRHLKYFEAAGELDEMWDVARLAIDTCRTMHGPIFLHLHCVRLWGHAGSDIETGYRTLDEIEATEARDPLLANARRLVETGAADAAMLLAIRRDVRERVRAAGEEATRRPRLTKRSTIVAPLAPFDEGKVRGAAERPGDAEVRTRHFHTLPENAQAPGRRTLAAHINHALADVMLAHPEVVVFGEDVGKKGGVYGLTAGLQKAFGEARVFDTLLDETTVLGVAQGHGHVGFLPVPEIQYLAYVHNAIDQLRGEAASLSFFANGQFENPMVVRIAGFAYQKGFGGHFHNDNSIGALRDIPGLVLAAPARGDDAAQMLRACVALAAECGRVVCFLEPIALYHERDLFEAGDGGWLTDYPAPGKAILPGEVGVYAEDARELLIVTYANGLRLALRAARELEHDHGLRARVVDLRWLNPLPAEAVRRHADDCGRVLVVDECRATGGGIADAVVAELAESGFRGPLRSVRAADSFVPLGTAADEVLVQQDEIVEAAVRLARLEREAR